MSLDPSAWKETRQRLQELLGKECPILRDNQELRQKYSNETREGRDVTDCF